jgi:hypothetical protein
MIPRLARRHAASTATLSTAECATLIALLHKLRVPVDGLGRFRFRDLADTAASRWPDKGVPVTAVSPGTGLRGSFHCPLRSRPYHKGS